MGFYHTLIEGCQSLHDVCRVCCRFVNFKVLNVRLCLRAPPSPLKNTFSHLTTSRVHALLQLLYSYKGRVVAFFCPSAIHTQRFKPDSIMCDNIRADVPHSQHSHRDTQTWACLVCVQQFYYFQIVSYHRRATESSQDAIHVFSMILSVRMRGMSILSGMHVYGSIQGCRQMYPRGI